MISSLWNIVYEVEMGRNTFRIIRTSVAVFLLRFVIVLVGSLICFFSLYAESIASVSARDIKLYSETTNGKWKVWFKNESSKTVNFSFCTIFHYHKNDIKHIYNSCKTSVIERRVYRGKYVSEGYRSGIRRLAGMIGYKIDGQFYEGGNYPAHWILKPGDVLNLTGATGCSPAAKREETPLGTKYCRDLTTPWVSRSVQAEMVDKPIKSHFVRFACGKELLSEARFLFWKEKKYGYTKPRVVESARGVPTKFDCRPCNEKRHLHYLFGWTKACPTNDPTNFDLPSVGEYLSGWE